MTAAQPRYRLVLPTASGYYIVSSYNTKGRCGMLWADAVRAFHSAQRADATLFPWPQQQLNYRLIQVSS